MARFLKSVAGLTFFTRNSGGDCIFAAYHPRKYTTWVWSLTLTRRQPGLTSILSLASNRRHQWHDYLRLPFGYALCLSRQDYHLERDQ